MKNIDAVLDTDEKHMTIDGVLHSVIGHRSFEDFNGTLESFKVMDVMANVRVVYTNDDALTFFADEFPPEIKEPSEGEAKTVVPFPATPPPNFYADAKAEFERNYSN